MSDFCREQTPCKPIFDTLSILEPYPKSTPADNSPFFCQQICEIHKEKTIKICIYQKKAVLLHAICGQTYKNEKENRIQFSSLDGFGSDEL